MRTQARKTTLSPELHAELSAELESLLDERDDLESHARAVRKAFRGELEVIADSIARTRLRLKGATGLQTEIPGTEIGQRKRNPAVLEILAAAKRVRDAEEDIDRRGLEAAFPDAEVEKVTLHRGTKAELDRKLHELVHPDKHVGTDGREGAPRASGALIHPGPAGWHERDHHRGPGRPKKARSAPEPEAEE